MSSAVLPSADAVVRECLDAIPVPLHQVTVLTDRQDLHTLTHPQKVASRRVKNLVNAAEPHLDDIENPELAHRLHARLAIKPHLV